MSEIKHTPGPWDAVEVQPRNVDYNGDDLIVLLKNGVVLAKVEKYYDTDERRANANLIATAPELLEVLKRARKFVYSVAPHGGLIDAIDQVISKATGQKQ